MWKIFSQLTKITSSSSSRTRPQERNPSPTGAFNGTRVTPSTIEVPPAPIRPQAVLSSALPEGESVPPAYSERLLPGETPGTAPRPTVPPPTYTELPGSVPAPRQWHHDVMNIRRVDRLEHAAFHRNSLQQVFELNHDWFNNGRFLDGLRPEFRSMAYDAAINSLTSDYSNLERADVNAICALSDVFDYIHSLPIREDEKALLLRALEGVIRERMRSNYRNSQTPSRLNPLAEFERACEECLGSQEAWQDTLRRITNDFARDPRFRFITPEFIENFGSLGTHADDLVVERPAARLTPATPVTPVIQVTPRVIPAAAEVEQIPADTTPHCLVRNLPLEEQERFNRERFEHLHNMHPEWFVGGRLANGVLLAHRRFVCIAGIDNLLNDLEYAARRNGYTNYVLRDVFASMEELPMSLQERTYILAALRSILRAKAQTLLATSSTPNAEVPYGIFMNACRATFDTSYGWVQALNEIRRNYRSTSPLYAFVTPEFIARNSALHPVARVAPTPVVVAPENYPRPLSLSTDEQARFERNNLWELYNVHPNWFGVRRVLDGVEPHYRVQAFEHGVDMLLENFGDPSQRNGFTNAILRDVFAHIDALPISDEERRGLIDGLRVRISHEITRLYQYQHYEIASVNACTLMIRACNNLFGSKQSWEDSLKWIKRNCGSDPTSGSDPIFGFMTTAFIEHFGTLGEQGTVATPLRQPRPLPVLRDAPLPVSRTPAQAEAELTEAQIARIQRGELPTQTGWMANIPQEQRQGAIAGIVKELLALHADELAEYTMTDWAVETADAKHVRHLVNLLNGCTRDEVTVPRDAFFKKIAKTVRKDLVRTITESGFTPEYNDNFKFLFSLTYWNELKKEENIDRMSHLYA